ncbi:MAG: nucleotidyltransferase family protein [bacterium]
MNNKIKEIQFKIIPILKKHEVRKSSIFGSFARGDNNKDSDIDMLVDLKDGKTLLDLIGLEMELEKKVKRKIDLLTYNSINPLLKKNILRDEVKIYG